MKKHVLMIASAAALLAACGPADNDPLPDPSIDPQTAPDTTAATDSPVTIAEAETAPLDEAVADENMSNYNAGFEVDVDTEMQAEAADGVWVTRADWTGFGPENSEAVLRVSCGEYGTINISRSVDIDPDKPVEAIVAAGDQTESGYWKASETTQMPAAELELYARSPIFDALTGADKIGFMGNGMPALIVPGDALLNERVATCRETGSGTTAPMP